MAFPPYLDRSIREVIKIDVFTAEIFRHFAAIGDDRLAV
jgi:hypothetical protein